MKTLFHIALILIHSTLLFSQKDFAGEIKWGKPTPIKKNELGCQQIQVLNNKIYTAITTRKQDFTQVYDLTSLTFEEEKILNLTYNNHKYTLLNTIVFGEQMLYISYYWDEALKETTFLIHTLLNGNIEKPKRIAIEKMYSSPVKNEEFMIDMWGKGYFQYVISDNSEFMMILFRDNEGSMLSKDKQTHAILFDKQFNELKRANFDWLVFENKKFRLDNKGLLYFTSPEGIEIFDGVKTEIVSINFPEFRFVWDFELLADGSLMVYGATRINRSVGISGTFFIHLDSNKVEQYNVLENFEEGYLPFPLIDFEKAGYTLKIHDLIVGENGEMTLLFEQYSYYEDTYAFINSAGSVTRTVSDRYMYGNIIAVHFTQLGVVKWKELIPKRQPSFNDAGNCSSFFTFQQENKVYLVYNASIYHWGKGFVTITSIDETGVINSQNLLEFKSSSGELINPSYCKKISDNEFILFKFDSKSKKKQIGRVVF